MRLQTAVTYESKLGRSKKPGEEKSYQQRAVDELLTITDNLLQSAKSGGGGNSTSYSVTAFF